MPHPGAASRIRYAAVVLAIVALGSAAEFATFARSDMAFLLYAAERVLDGARLYVDVVEINPPLIIAWNLPAVLIARGLGVSDIPVLRMWDSLVLLGSLTFSFWALRLALGADRSRLRWIGLLLAAGLFLLPENDFAQREHLLVALILPYVLLASVRVEGRAVAPGAAWSAGVLAGIGLALKPHFLLVWLSLEGYVTWRARARRLAPEALGALSFLALYAIGVVIFTREFFRMASLLGMAYTSFGHYSFSTVLVTAQGAPEVFLALLACLALRRCARHPALWHILAVALAASFIAGAAQLKGWTYHFLPARVLALLLIGLTVLDVRRPLLRPVARVYAAVAAGVLGTTLIWITSMAALRVLHRDPVRESEQAQLDELVKEVRRRMPSNGSLYIFSYTIGSSFPLVNYAGVRWASRFPHLWIVEAAYHDQLTRDPPIQYHSPAEMGPAERYLNAAVAQDLARYRPDVLMVLRHARDAPENSLRRLDYIRYFERDPRIARELGQYRYADNVGQYDVYVRAARPDQPGERPASRPGNKDVLRGTQSGANALVADRSFVLQLAMFLALALVAFLNEQRGFTASRERPTGNAKAAPGGCS